MGDLLNQHKSCHWAQSQHFSSSVPIPYSTKDWMDMSYCLLGFNTCILWESLQIGKLSAFLQLGTTFLRPVHMPRSCGKQPLETAFCHLETKMSKITRRQGGYSFFLMKKKWKNHSVTCWINQIRREMCRESSLLRQDKKIIKEDCQNILLFTITWLAKENMSVHRLILYLHHCRFQSQPSAFPQLHPSFLRGHSWAWSDPGMPLSSSLALQLLRCLLWSWALASMGRLYYSEWYNENNIATAA